MSGSGAGCRHVAPWQFHRAIEMHELRSSFYEEGSRNAVNEISDCFGEQSENRRRRTEPEDTRTFYIGDVIEAESAETDTRRAKF